MLNLDLDTVWMIHERSENEDFIQWCIEMDMNFLLNINSSNDKLQLYSLRNFHDLIYYLYEEHDIIRMIKKLTKKFPNVQFPNGEECDTNLVLLLFGNLGDYSDEELFHHHDALQIKIMLARIEICWNLI